MDEEHQETATGESTGVPPADAPAAKAKRSLQAVAADLWHQKPGARAPKARTPLPAGTKEVVNGLDRREFALGLVATGLNVVTAVSGYFINRHGPSLAVRNAAADLLVAGLVVGVLLLVGTLLRRRALLGFASFMTGMEIIAGGNVFGVLFLGFGAWLIARVMRKQKQEQAAGTYKGTIDPKSRRSGPAPRAPKASKRYTPPRRTSAGAARKR